MASATKIVKKVQKAAQSVAKSAGYKRFDGRMQILKTRVTWNAVVLP